MARLTETFRDLARLKQTCLIPYITAGFPRPDLTPDLLQAMAAGGANILEVGVPFSDPLADGATIQRSSQAALAAGVTPARCFEYVAAARAKGVDQPIVLMGYVNPILRFGVEAYLAAAESAGVDGLIVPDLPPEEAADLRAACQRHGIDLTFLLAPTSTDARIRSVAEQTTGFLYCVSLTGVTGARQDLQSGLPEFLARVRQQTDLPLAVGFGIGTPEQAVQVAQVADGVAIGSALVDRLGRASPDQASEAAGEFVRSFRQALDGATEAADKRAADPVGDPARPPA
jgi:tryptophan synthase alpha chain